MASVRVAELDGAVVVALALRTGRVVADPFSPTAAVEGKRTAA